MRRIRSLAAAAVLTTLACAGHATELEPLGPREAARRARFVAREISPHAEQFYPYYESVRGYGLVLEAEVVGEGTGAEYWRQAALDRARLATRVAVGLEDLAQRVAPPPPEALTAEARRIAGRLQRLAADLPPSSTDWREVAEGLRVAFAGLAADLHALHDALHGAARHSLVPVSLSLYLHGETLVSAAPEGDGGEGYWRRVAEDQHRRSRRVSLASAGHVRFMAGESRRALLLEVSAIRMIRLRPQADEPGWRAEAQRLAALLFDHRRTMQVLSESEG